MALTVLTNNPKGLLAAIYKGIDDGNIDTWGYDKDGDFTHTPTQWKDKAWLKPDAGDQLRFKIIGQKSVPLSKEIYAVYHGRFSEMLLAHFDDRLTAVTASPKSSA